jgi:hypothetical protein
MKSVARLKEKISLPEATVVVGWTHWSAPSDIRLNIQTTHSRTAYENGDVETRQILLTRNQAMLLAHYLVNVTDQRLPSKRRRTWWQKLRAMMR